MSKIITPKPIILTGEFQAIAVPRYSFAGLYEKLKDQNWAFISIQNSDDREGEQEIYQEGPNLMIQIFDDVNIEYGRAKAISDDQALALVKFIQDNRQRSFIVHCTAGICRSGAVVTFIHNYQTETNKEYARTWEEFKTDNPYILPNQLVLKKLRIAHEKLSKT